MAKKRKNTPTSKADGTNSSNGAKTGAAAKTPFQYFPLHLVTNKRPRNDADQLTLKELQPGTVWVIPDFFSSQECQSWIDFCESSDGFQYTSHPASRYIAQRECYRMQQTNATDLAELMYRRMEKGGILPQLNRELAPMRFPKGYQPLGFNPNLRLYKYTKGHAFGKHVDGSNLVESMGMTEITVLIYLSSCKGGATRFYPPSSRRKQASVAFDPEPGTMLLHVHGDRCLEHEADQVLDGVKYVLRTDLVFNTL
jgi:hypothetical protein